MICTWWVYVRRKKALFNNIRRFRSKEGKVTFIHGANRWNQNILRTDPYTHSLIFVYLSLLFVLSQQAEGVRLLSPCRSVAWYGVQVRRKMLWYQWLLWQVLFLIPPSLDQLRISPFKLVNDLMWCRPPFFHPVKIEET